MLVQALAHEVACYLGLELGGIKIKRFADGEIYVQVQVCAAPAPSLVPLSSLEAAAVCQVLHRECTTSLILMMIGFLELAACQHSPSPRWAPSCCL